MHLHEFEHYDWARLRCEPAWSAKGVPGALLRLATATTEEEARQAYWQIDSIVVGQGALYAAALPTVICALGLLPHCTGIARPWMLELLEIICSGEPASSELSFGNYTLAEDCRRELGHGAALFFDLLEHGTREEHLWCVDLLFLCCLEDATLKGRVIWWFQRLLSGELEAQERAFIENCLAGLLE